MATCFTCSRLDRGLFSPQGAFCSMECMNHPPTGDKPYMPYQEVDMQIDEDIKKPLREYSKVEAQNLVHSIVGTWINFRRANAGLPPKEFTPWHHEEDFLDTCLLEAKPERTDIVRSVVDTFIRECVADVPFG